MHGAWTDYMEVFMRNLSVGRISAKTGMLLLAGTVWASGGESGGPQTPASRTPAAFPIPVPAAPAGGAQSAPAADKLVAAPAEVADARRCCHGGSDMYGIVNLVPFHAFVADINRRGQAAFEYVGLDTVLHTGFFDGERVVDPLPTETTLSALGGLNDRGELALMVRYRDAPPPSSYVFHPVRWSAARGAVPLPSRISANSTYVSSINSRGDIVGATATLPDGSGYLADRWTPANSLLSLPSPAGFDNVFALDINDNKVSVGYGITVPGNVAQAIRWDEAGRPSVIGTFGAGGAVSHAVNNRGEIAGMLDPAHPDAYQAFLWSPGSGAAPIGARTVFHQMNEAGQVVGRIQRPDNDNHAYFFSRGRGLVDLHPRAFFASEANDIDEHGVIVGLARPTVSSEDRAWRWSRAGSVDLNARLLNPPSGLVVTNALGIAANGDIVANSNAGVVVLRHGGRGTDAPVVGPIQLSELRLNAPFRLALSFRDRNPGDTHRATIDWGDGRGPQAASVREYRGKGVVRAAHTYTTEGDYNIVVRVTDSTGKTTMQVEQRLIRELDTPLLLGEGILSEDGSSAAAGGAVRRPMMFRLSAPLAIDDGAAAPFAFQLSGRTSFTGERLDRATREGNRVRLEGTGRLNGRAGHRFALEAVVGTRPAAMDRISVRITTAEAPAGAQPLATRSTADAARAESSQASVLSGQVRHGSLRLLP